MIGKQMQLLFLSLLLYTVFPSMTEQVSDNAMQNYKKAVSLVERGRTAEASLYYKKACLQDVKTARLKDYGLSTVLVNDISKSSNSYEAAQLLLMFGYAEKAISYLEKSLNEFHPGSREYLFAQTKLSTLKKAKHILIPEKHATDEIKGTPWEITESTTNEIIHKSSVNITNFHQKLKLLEQRSKQVAQQIVKVGEELMLKEAQVLEKQGELEDFKIRFSQLPDNAPMKDHFRKKVDEAEKDLEIVKKKLGKLKGSFKDLQSYKQDIDLFLKKYE